MLERCTHSSKAEGWRCLQITHEETGRVRQCSTQEDTENSLTRTTEEGKYEGMMSAETHTRGLCLSVSVTVGQQIIPALMSEDAGMITQQRGERVSLVPSSPAEWMRERMNERITCSSRASADQTSRWCFNSLGAPTSTSRVYR